MNVSRGLRLLTSTLIEFCFTILMRGKLTLSWRRPLSYRNQDELTSAGISPKGKNLDKGNYSVSFPTCQKFLAESSTNKSSISRWLFFAILGWDCGFENHNSQHQSLKLWRSEKNILIWDEIGTILIDFSKAFDTINYNFLPAK